MKCYIVVKIERDEKTLMDSTRIIGIYRSFKTAEEIAQRMQAEIYKEGLDDCAWIEIIESELE